MVKGFFGDYRWLSNFHRCNIKFEGQWYSSSEHAYQAAKSNDPEVRATISALSTPKEAKRMGSKIKLRPDWEHVKLQVMETILRDKFKDPYLYNLLLATGEQELIEGNTWNDTFWGQCEGKGLNHLGKILMKIRTDLKNVNKERNSSTASNS